MNPKAQRRGAPLVALGLILVLWAVVRVTTWQQPSGIAVSRSAQAGIAAFDERIGPMAAGAGGGWRGVVGEAPAGPDLPVVAAPPNLGGAVELDPVRRTYLPPNVVPAPAKDVIVTPVALAAGHNQLWLAALARLPLPSAVQVFAPVVVAPPPTAAARVPVAPTRRWSGDAWLLWRGGGGSGLASPAAPPSYGASQAGAVIRYRLLATNAHRPAAYARASAALEDRAEREVAFGLSLRPIAGLPLVASGELRAADRGGGLKVHPAAFVVTELPAADLPGGLRAEAYAQAGYVGGRDATAFADGQLRVDRRVALVGPAELRIGAGAWGGAQDGASRFDVGPGATLGVAGRGGAARLAFDWRWRVAGKAEPASGPALTLSAGF